MVFEIRKKERVHIALINIWKMLRISLFALMFVVGIATGLFFIGKNGSLLMLRTAISLYIGSGLFVTYFLILFIVAFMKILIKLKKNEERLNKDTYSIEIDIVDDDQLQIKSLDVNTIVKKSQIKWVKENKEYIFFYIALRKRIYEFFSVPKSIEPSVKDYILSCKNQKAITPPVLLVVMFFLILFITIGVMNTRKGSSINTQDRKTYEFIQEKYPSKMLENLYPMNSVQYEPTSESYYYYQMTYFILPLNPSTVGIVILKYTEEDYNFVRQLITSAVQESTWEANYEGTTFYIHPNFTTEETYGFIGYNDEANQIVLLGYKDGYFIYSNLIENDFEDFIQKAYKDIYPKK